jgi:predicted DNA-binding ribbon-helix-helix protein
MPGKRIQIDDETWPQLRMMARDRMMTFQELADEAFADLLKKHGRPVDLRAALRKSADARAEVVPLKPKTKSRRRA